MNTNTNNETTIRTIDSHALSAVTGGGTNVRPYFGMNPRTGAVAGSAADHVYGEKPRVGYGTIKAYAL